MYLSFIRRQTSSIALQTTERRGYIKVLGLVQLVESCKLPGFASSVTIFSFIVLEQFQKRERQDKDFVLSLLTLREHFCYTCVYIWQGYIQKPPPLHFVTNFSTRLANITVLLRQSCDCSCYASRAILAPQPGLQALPGPDDREFVKLILLYIFVCLSASHFF